MNDQSHRSFPELRDLGLNEREARVYLALLDQGEIVPGRGTTRNR